MEIALAIKLHDKQYAGGSKKERKKEITSNSKAISFDIPEYGKVHISAECCVKGERWRDSEKEIPSGITALDIHLYTEYQSSNQGGY